MTKSSPKQSVVIYDIWRKAAGFTVDKFWKEILLGCSYGKFPRGAKYDESTNVLFVKDMNIPGNTRSTAYSLPIDEYEICEYAIKIFKTKLKLYSPYDIQLKIKEYENCTASPVLDLNCEWNKLKPKSIKDILLIKYILSLKEKYSLTKKELNILLTTLHVGINMKLIISSDIEYSDGVIHNIKGFEKIPGKNVWINTNVQKQTPAHRSVTLNNTMSTNHNNHVGKAIEKYISKIR